MPKCDLSSLVRSKGVCKYVPAGVEDKIYLFDIDAIDKSKRAPNDETGLYAADTFSGVTFYPLDIKSNSGKVSSEKSESDESRTLTFTAIVNYKLDEFLALDATLAFINVGAIVPMNSDKAYVVMSPYARSNYKSSFDSGDTYDSEHGYTITIECSPVVFACPMVKLTDVPNLTGGGSDNSKVTAVTMGSGLATTVKVDSTIQLSATTTPAGGTITWSSSDTSKARVDSTGKVTGVAVGTGIVITATCNSKSASHTISVTT